MNQHNVCLRNAGKFKNKRVFDGFGNFHSSMFRRIGFQSRRFAAVTMTFGISTSAMQMTWIMKDVRRQAKAVVASALLLLISFGSPAIAASTTELNLERCEAAARTVEFTPAMFTAMTGIGPDQGVLVMGPLIAPNTYQLALRTIGCDCSITPVVFGMARLTNRTRTALYDGEVSIMVGVGGGSSVPVQLTTLGVEATYEIATFSGWSGTVRGARVTFIGTETGSTPQSTVAFYPQESVLASPLDLPAHFASFASVSENTIDCDGLTEKQCFELRKCFNHFNTCNTKADDKYAISINGCNDWSFTLLCAGSGAVAGVEIGCTGGPVGAAVGCVIGGVAGGCVGYFACLRQARNGRDVAYSDCVNDLGGCLENWIIMP